MSTVVDRLPKGLREDSLGDGGFYVGSREASFSGRCSKNPEKLEGIQLGVCSKEGTTIHSVYVDDVGAAFYLPKPDGKYERFGPEDGVENRYDFSKRWELYSRKDAAAAHVAGIAKRWLWSGPEALSPSEMKELTVLGRSRGEIYSYVLDHWKQQGDLAEDVELMSGAIVYWMSIKEVESVYFPKAVEAFSQLTERAVLQGGMAVWLRRFDLGGLFGSSCPVETRREVYDLLVDLAWNPSTSVEEREWALDLLTNRYINFGWGGSEESGKKILTAIADDNVSPKVRVEFARFVSSHGSRFDPTQHQTASVVIASLAFDKTVAPDVRLGALELLWDPSAEIEVQNRYREAFRSMAEDKSIAAVIRYKAFGNLGYYGGWFDVGVGSHVLDTATSRQRKVQVLVDFLSHAELDREILVVALFTFPEDLTPLLRQKINVALLDIVQAPPGKVTPALRTVAASHLLENPLTPDEKFKAESALLEMAGLSEKDALSDETRISAAQQVLERSSDLVHRSVATQILINLLLAGKLSGGDSVRLLVRTPEATQREKIISYIRKPEKTPPEYQSYFVPEHILSYLSEQPISSYEKCTIARCLYDEEEQQVVGFLEKCSVPDKPATLVVNWHQ